MTSNDRGTVSQAGLGFSRSENDTVTDFPPNGTWLVPGHYSKFQFSTAAATPTLEQEIGVSTIGSDVFNWRLNPPSLNMNMYADATIRFQPLLVFGSILFAVYSFVAMNTLDHHTSPNLLSVPWEWVMLRKCHQHPVIHLVPPFTCLIVPTIAPT